jgi:hypothetical protein
MTSVTVVMPIGPAHPVDYVRDTVHTLAEFLPGARLIALDDSGSGIGREVAPPGSTVLTTPTGYGGLAGQLYRRLSLAFLEALTAPFDILLRLDTDAILLGGAFASRASTLFEQHPRVGALGCYRINYAGAGRVWDFPRSRIRGMLTHEAIKDPARARRVAWLLARAYVLGKLRRDRYELGEFISGGATIYSHRCVQALARAGLLDDPRLARTDMQEDHIFGLCVRAVGLRMHDFGSAHDDLPFAVTWRGLPAPPATLLAAGKEVVHSTKSHGDLVEQETRAYFRQARGL